MRIEITCVFHFRSRVRFFGVWAIDESACIATGFFFAVTRVFRAFTRTREREECGDRAQLLNSRPVTRNGEKKVLYFIFIFFFFFFFFFFFYEFRFRS